MVENVLQLHREGAVVTLDDHAEAVADQEGALADEPGEGGQSLSALRHQVEVSQRAHVLDEGTRPGAGLHLPGRQVQEPRALVVGHGHALSKRRRAPPVARCRCWS